jgi:NADH dehydrogenase
MQEGRYAAKVVLARLKGAEHKPFHYVDKGNVATIGRLKAVADIRGMRLSGTLAWLTWLFVHLFYLVGLQNRMLVFIRWVVSFMTRGRGARLITGEGVEAGAARREPEREATRTG